MLELYLTPQLYGHKGQYYKARVIRYFCNNKVINTLYSNGIPIMTIIQNANTDKNDFTRHIDVFRLLTQTTMKHIREFLFQCNKSKNKTENDFLTFTKDDFIALPPDDYFNNEDGYSNHDYNNRVKKLI